MPLATTSLAGLTSLTVRQAPPSGTGAAVALTLRTWTLSRTVAATLQVIDVSGCYSLSLIDFVRSCVQLRCLWMPGCDSVSDLSPLAACSETLEELWMAMTAIGQVVILAPLEACNKLHKLDLRGCNFDYDELVGPESSEGVREAAAGALGSLAYKHHHNKDVIAAAGAIPALVQLLGSASARVRTEAAHALGILADNHVQNQACISAAGAIPVLVQLLLEPESKSFEDPQMAAARALGCLAKEDPPNQAAIAASGAIEALVWLLVGPEFSEDMQEAAARALGILADNHAQNKAAITAAGAIPAFGSGLSTGACSG
ncbi:hypothetical protein FOA52_006979 [Chlamydomonas sp. UWO 241]|nr:hypothetical protein FOA52_006979 [Chlamydomonas sp. UWO 241]